ncbi:hypothetical protein BBJ28_00008780 [Nothophytophthora sp. Chile5]|nr:hypothetical protein BBJ28_00008780 [Nothophytophthora sp. Chile5]
MDRLIYGFLSDSLFPLVLTTLIGEIAGIVFTAVYFYWSPDRPYVLKACAVVFVGWLAFSIYVVLGKTGVTHQSGDEVADVAGYAGAVLSTLLFASPLEALWQVFKTKSVASIPINFSVMVAVACALWVGIAFVDDDLFILVPNAAGVVLAAIQIVVYLIYRPRRGNDAALEDLGEDAPDCIAVIVSPKGGWPTTNKSPVYQPLASPLKPATV